MQAAILKEKSNTDLRVKSWRWSQFELPSAKCVILSSSGWKAYSFDQGINLNSILEQVLDQIFSVKLSSRRVDEIKIWDLTTTLKKIVSSLRDNGYYFYFRGFRATLSYSLVSWWWISMCTRVLSQYLHWAIYIVALVNIWFINIVSGLEPKSYFLRLLSC